MSILLSCIFVACSGRAPQQEAQLQFKGDYADAIFDTISVDLKDAEFIEC